jgi:hypothetical protein
MNFQREKVVLKPEELLPLRIRCLEGGLEDFGFYVYVSSKSSYPSLEDFLGPLLNFRMVREVGGFDEETANEYLDEIRAFEDLDISEASSLFSEWEKATGKKLPVSLETMRDASIFGKTDLANLVGEMLIIAESEYVFVSIV